MQKLHIVARALRRSLLVVSMMSASAGFSGCSVMLAATSPAQPEPGVIKVGALRTEVERQLGRPINLVRTNRGDIATYTYLGPDEVSYRRATAYALADVFTLGVFELVASPVETLQNDKHTLTITYGWKGRVKAIAEDILKAPLDRPEKMLGIETLRQT